MGATEEPLKRKSSGCSQEIENTAVGIRRAGQATIFIRKSWH
jgi:hypothetical protein